MFDHSTDDTNDDYNTLIKAVLSAAAVDYTKLQHKKNRDKKYLEQSFLVSVQLFFDKDFRFGSFTDPDDEEKHLSLFDLLKILLQTNNVNLDQVKDFVKQDSITYWWTKNFHDMNIPDTVTIAGNVYIVANSKKHYVDFEENIIYLPKKSKGSDRKFYSICLDIMLKECNIDLPKNKQEEFFKILYLFLKINSAFEK